MTRKVTIFNTAGGNDKTVETSAMTWGELQVDLIKNNVRFENLQAVIGETQNTLGSTQSLLIDGDFTLFLIPQKVKSGTWNFEEMIDDEAGEELKDLQNMSDEDWESFSPDDYEYKTKQALAYAYSKKAESYIKQAAILISMSTSSSTTIQDTTRDPNDVRADLARKAEQIKSNMGIYD